MSASVRKKARKEDKPVPDPVELVFHHTDLLLACVAPHLSLVERSCLARINKRTHKAFKRRDPSLGMMCRLWKNKFIQPAERETVVIKSGNLECVKHLWYRCHDVDELCLTGHFVSHAAAAGNANVLQFVMLRSHPNVRSSMLDNVLTLLCQGRFEQLAINVFTNENQQWYPATVFMPEFIYNVWKMSIRKRCYAFEKVVKTKIGLSDEQTAVMSMMMFLTLDTDAFDHFWSETPQHLRQHLTPLLHQFCASAPPGREYPMITHVMMRLTSSDN